MHVDWRTRWIVVFMAVGIAVRLIRYLLRFPLWADESFLAVNFFHRGYGDLMRPLDCHQVAPLLFLWTELSAVKLLGFNEWTLRLVPMLSGIASILLFHRLARYLVRGTALVLAVGVFAVNYSGVRYACEVKPYGVDLMVSTLILLLTVRSWNQPDDTRRLWMLTAVMPFALGLSFPALFMAGGASVAIAAVLLGSPIAPRLDGMDRVQRCHGRELSRLVSACHPRPGAGRNGCNDLGLERRLPAARFAGQTGRVAPSCPRWPTLGRAGGRRQLGQHGDAIAVPCRRGRALSAGSLSPALAHRRAFRLEPAGGGTAALSLRRSHAAGDASGADRVHPRGRRRRGVFVSPLPPGEGGHRHWSRGRTTFPSRRPTRPARAPIVIVFTLLLTLATAYLARDFYLPAKEQSDIRKRDFAVWFWSGLSAGHEVVCLADDLPLALPPLGKSGQGRAAPQFLCNESIYSPRAARASLATWTTFLSNVHWLVCITGRIWPLTIRPNSPVGWRL